MRDRRALQKETAVPAEPRNGGGNQVRKLPRHPTSKYRTAPLPLTSVRLVGCFSDDGYLFGWEVVQ